MLSLVTLTALSGFSKSINRSLLEDAKKLHAGDIIIRSYEKISNGLEEEVQLLRNQGEIDVSTYYEFYSVVRTREENQSVLARLKVVDERYPFYGDIVLASGNEFSDVLSRGHVLVEQALLDRLGMEIGDKLRVGYSILTISDLVVSEPDRPVNVFSFGPRVFISSKDLEKI